MESLRGYSTASAFGIMETLVVCCEGYASVSSGYRSVVCPVSSAYIDPTTTASGVPPYERTKLMATRFRLKPDEAAIAAIVSRT